MEVKFSLISNSVLINNTICEVLRLNDITCRYYLVLSRNEITEIVKFKNELLDNYDRIEFGSGVIDKLVMKFCDSSYIWQDNYVDIIKQLLETFYYFKNEFIEELSDDELLDIMKYYFDNSCNGSIELLQSRELEIYNSLIKNQYYENEHYEDEGFNSYEEEK